MTDSLTRPARPALATVHGFQIITRWEQFAPTAATFIGRRLARMGDDGAISLGLSGGSTPAPVYEALAGLPDLPWHRIHLFFADERAVAPDDDASNYRLVRKTLLAEGDIEPAGVHRMEADGADLDAAASAYEAELPERLDLLLLGIGEDGHTASLFPGSEQLIPGAGRVLAVTDAPKPPPRRLTIAPHVILAARLVVVLARGADKAPAVAAALSGGDDVGACPARLARRGVWILDRAAAGV